MRKLLLFIVYAIVIFAIMAGFTCLVWLPMFLLPNLSGFIIGGFITAATIATTYLALGN